MGKICFAHSEGKNNFLKFSFSSIFAFTVKAKEHILFWVQPLQMLH